MAKASNNKHNCRKHTHKEERRRERERERENGRVARGAHLHPHHFHSSSTSHPFCEHFVYQFCCFIHLFACLLMPRGEGEAKIMRSVMAKATNITLKRSIFGFFLVLD
jgi:hypothetical protein